MGRWPGCCLRSGPAEGFRVYIGSLNVSLDCIFEIGERAEHASLEGAFTQQREEPFDLVDP